VISTLVWAGPLNPPAGAVSSTYKTLTEVEPRIAINSTNTPGDADSLFKISQPGSYYLTGNITGVSGKHGIEIAANNVTLDLRGFDLVGVSAPGYDGVRTTVNSLTNITVVHGSIQNWGQDGVNFGDYPANGGLIHDVHTADNARSGIHTENGFRVSECSNMGGQYGIYAQGYGTSVSGCTTYGTSLIGIRVFGGSVVDCAVYDSSGTGISTGVATTLSNCSVYRSGGTGISASGDCVLTHCSAQGNGGTGISAGVGSTLLNCSAGSNTGFGIFVSDGCVVSGSSAKSNGGTGIRITGSGSAIDCVAAQNSLHGISVGDGCTVRGCTSSGNTNRGIDAYNGCHIENNLTRNNLADGIFVNFSCVVRSNNCNGDGSAAGDHGGIRVGGQANRIEGNNVTYADRGYLVESGGNIIVRNTALGNTLNWSVVAGNKVLVVSGVNAGAISGNSGGASPGSTDPSANFTY
jgi:parallel beta-helix repeat protein